jgi:hypothetical protein
MSSSEVSMQVSGLKTELKEMDLNSKRANGFWHTQNSIAFNNKIENNETFTELLLEFAYINKPIVHRGVN